VEKVRRAAETGIPIVVLTGYESREEELRLKCMAAGASDFMLKLKANQRPEDLCERVYLAHLRRIFTNAHGRSAIRNSPSI
jgi:CheY-like chemotaxis protein